MNVIAQDSTNLIVAEITIAEGESVSEIFPSHGLALVGVFMPAGWDAAKLRLNAVLTAAGTPVPVVDTGGNAWESTVAVDQFIALGGNDAVYAPFLQFLSDNGAGVAVVQTAARTLTVVLRKYLS